MVYFMVTRKEMIMARLGYGHIERDHVCIHYYRIPDDKPPVVLLHGLGDNGLCWNRLALALEPSFDVIMMDARGHGFSDAPDSGYGADERVADVACLIETLHLAKPQLIGHSIGADTALRVAAVFPGLVSSVVLEDPPFRSATLEESTDDIPDRKELIKNFLLDLKGKSVDELILLGKQKYPGWDETEFIQWAKAKQQFNPKSFAGLSEPGMSWQAIIPLVQCPGLLITGDPERGSIVTNTVAEEIRSLWRKVKIAYIPGAGHNIRREQFMSYRAEVIGFLENRKTAQKRSIFHLFRHDDQLN
jgi:N-formylmaleamate deformylase